MRQKVVYGKWIHASKLVALENIHYVDQAESIISSSSIGRSTSASKVLHFQQYRIDRFPSP